MNYNITFAWIEYEDVLILFKIGDWILEYPDNCEKIDNFKNGILILFEQSQSIDFYKSLLKISSSTAHKFIEKQIHLVKLTGQFQLMIDNYLVDLKIYKSNYKILEREENYNSLHNQIVIILSKFSEALVQSVVFSELFYDRPEHVQRYIELYIEAIMNYIDVHKNNSIKRFTIFISQENKECFLNVAQNHFFRFRCYSYIN